jgi:hypothetical protein
MVHFHLLTFIFLYSNKTMMKEVYKLWPELNWISDEKLRDATAKTWQLALERSVLTPADLNRIPFTLLCGPDLKVTFMDHKRSVVHIARDAGDKINEMYHGELPVHMDVLIAGAILADVGKLLEYILDENGKAIQGSYGKYLRHPFSRSFTGRRSRCTCISMSHYSNTCRRRQYGEKNNRSLPGTSC